MHIGNIVRNLRARHVMRTKIDTNNTLAVANDVGLMIGKRRILEDINLRLKKGRITTLIGPNGAGKTSLLRILLGLITPTEGTIGHYPGLRIGYMPQKIMIDPVLPISVHRFLKLGGSFSRQQLGDVLQEVGVTHLLDQPIQSVSGGEMQRILLARALLRKPQLLVLDEPAQGVDMGQQGEVFNLIARLRDRYDCGVLMVSHELHLVMAAADEVICLNRHVCCTGKPEMVSRHPAYRALFGDKINANIALYTHHHDHTHTLSGEVIKTSDGCK